MYKAILPDPPPFFWKVPQPEKEKDYMYENSKRIRQIAQQGQQRKEMRGRGEPFKANFIPGLTKNQKYAHVGSKIGQILKDNAQKSRENLMKKELERQNQYHNGGGRSSVGPGQSGSRQQQLNRRFSRSANDLVDPATSLVKGGKVATSANGAQKWPMGPPRHRSNRNPPLLPQYESVYNWRFNDDSQTRSSLSLNDQERYRNHHRIEYLPCDGICAEERHEEDVNASGRSSGSFKTSRGINTDETRIFMDSPMQNSNLYEDDEGEQGEEEKEVDQNVRRITKSVGKFTLKNPEASNQTRGDYHEVANHRDSGDGDSARINRERNNFSRIKQCDFSSETTVQSLAGHKYNNNGSQSINSIQNGVLSTNSHSPRSVKGAGPGDIPKYLLKRKEEWKKEEAEKKLAEENALIPAGHRQMSEQERQETLGVLKKNYDDLINELNRIPIRIDTIRVREQKVKLEQQLTKLEEAMKVFSRPRVFIKLNA